MGISGGVAPLFALRRHLDRYGFTPGVERGYFRRLAVALAGSGVVRRCRTVLQQFGRTANLRTDHGSLGIGALGGRGVLGLSLGTDWARAFESADSLFGGAR